MGIFTTVKADALLKARDKLTCMQILSAEGIDVPRDGIAAGDSCTGVVYDQVTKDRAVIKLLSSTQGLGVILCDKKIRVSPSSKDFIGWDKMCSFRNL